MKQITVNTNDLRSAVKRLGQSVNPNSILPAALDIHISVEPDKMIMTTTNLETTVQYTCPVEATEKFVIMLPFEFISKVVGAVTGETIVIEHPSVRRARLQCGDDVFELQGLTKVEEFPKIPAVPKGKGIALPEGFTKVLGNAALTVSTSDTTPALMFILIDIASDKIAVASTDAHFLFEHVSDIPSGEAIQLLVPKNIAKVIEGLEGAILYWNKSMVIIAAQDITVWGRLCDQKFPNYKAVIPTEPGEFIQVRKEDIVQAIKKAFISTDAKKLTKLILVGDKESVMLETSDMQLDRVIKSKIPSTPYSGSAEAISFSAKKMLTVLEQVDCESVNIHIRDAHKGMVIRGVGSENQTGLLMPIMNG